MSKHPMDRRDFLRNTVAGGVGFGVLGAAAGEAMSQAPAANEGKVPRKPLGSTGEVLPIIQMGTCQTMDLKYDRRLHRCFQMGVDHIDTAQMYADGQAQKAVGVFNKQIGDRKKLFIATKVYLGVQEASAQRFKEELDKCLHDMELEYVDLFYMHMAHDERYIEPEFIQLGEDLKKSGKSRFFGFSTHDGSVPRMLTKAAELGGGIDAILFRYNFRQYGNVELNRAIDAAKKAGIGLVAMKTLAAIPDDSEEIVPFRSENFNLVQAKLKAVWADERIDSICSQMSSVEHVMENTAAAMSPVKLSMDEYMQLHRLAALTSEHYCTGCHHICESRVAGKLRIADQMRYLMYHESYHECESARKLYDALRPEERDFDRVDLAEATKACPQRIDIRERLAKARQVLSA
ncbi:MAG TPA: aldo/keto reductase [Candidatus Hydrogenedentes bacterium]|nr:aldo/keto reductase [Candidatus Hydrogenedentota bacterium]